MKQEAEWGEGGLETWMHKPLAVVCLCWLHVSSAFIQQSETAECTGFAHLRKHTNTHVRMEGTEMQCKQDG